MGRVRIAVLVMPDSLLSRVIDANGTVVVEYTYDAWGKMLNVTGDENLKDVIWNFTVTMCTSDSLKTKDGGGNTREYARE